MIAAANGKILSVVLSIEQQNKGYLFYRLNDDLIKCFLY